MGQLRHFTKSLECPGLGFGVLFVGSFGGCRTLDGQLGGSGANDSELCSISYHLRNITIILGSYVIIATKLVSKVRS